MGTCHSLIFVQRRCCFLETDRDRQVTGSFSLEELHRSGNVAPKVQPLLWDESLVQKRVPGMIYAVAS